MERWVAALLAFAVPLGAGASARAEERASPARATPRRSVVEVFVVDPVGSDRELDDVLRELVGRLGVTVRLERVSEPPGALSGPARSDLLARVSVDLRRSGDASIAMVAAGDGAQTFRAASRGGPAPVVREEIAHIVQSCVESALFVESERRTPPPEATSAPPAPRDEAHPTPARGSDDAPSRLALDTAVTAGAGPVASSSGMVPRFGAAVGFAWASGPRPAFALSAAYLLPFDTADTSFVSAHVAMLSARAIPAVELARSARFSIDFGVGGGVDALAVTPRSRALPATVLGASSSRIDGVLSAIATAHTALTPNTSLTVALGLDLDVSRRSWVVDVDGARSSVFSPSRWRPLLLVGVALTPVGRGRFAAPEAPSERRVGAR